MTNEEYWDIQTTLAKARKLTEDVRNGRRVSTPLIHDDEQVEGTFNSGAFNSVEEYEKFLKK